MLRISLALGVCFTHLLSPSCENARSCSLCMVHVLCVQTTIRQPKLKALLKARCVQVDMKHLENTGDKRNDSKEKVRGNIVGLWNSKLRPRIFLPFDNVKYYPFGGRDLS